MERLQKYLARCGVASRRKAEEMIVSGLVAVNGQVVRELGVKVDPERDRVTVAGRPVRPDEERIYLMLNKPPGYITGNRDPRGRKTVLALLPEGFPRVFPVGRLDYNTTGLLLLTNDGALAYALTHPKYEIQKVYRALVRGVPDARALNMLRQGVVLEDGPTLPASVDIIKVKAGNAILKIGLREGRNRQVRRMCAAVGHPVLKLERLAIGPLQLGDLPLGRYRRLTAAELKALQKLIDRARLAVAEEKGEDDAPDQKR
ncbi:MAG TPA: rRNA pseudouridine synthase [Firmicutes bacterium]|uniref:Pseudouridine synthase n=1 Tax=Capillibacterium thermochitinicola TaxID=2699427 RepID=A0A8J6LLC1_9FIRM|nr:pseudouridine synthase [Capillibacterium thermochitinicola]MBA2131958.1 rRNA pseudouridine synthase [Capillibacterium thermochitinicola]HHW12556.1 rRNA pseudouridine synthase [Bacillota bacterium]